MITMMAIMTLIMTMISMIKMIKIVIRKKFFAFTYTNLNMSFLFTAEYCPRLTLSGYDVTVICFL